MRPALIALDDAVSSALSPTASGCRSAGGSGRFRATPEMRFGGQSRE